MSPLLRLLAAAGLAALAAAPPAAPQDGPPLSPEEQALVASLGEHGIFLEPRQRWVAVETEILVRDDLLEYLLVGPGGAAHESLLMTRARPSLIQVALLALGVQPGTNATWSRKDPPPPAEELEAGAPIYDLALPSGDALHLHIGWREGSEVYFYRAEDLLRDLSAGRGMRRHAWVFLGSRMVSYGRGGGETFAADLHQNLISVTFFSDGFQLLTAALPESVEQTIWMANSWLVPPSGSKVALVLARDALTGPPEGLVARLPELPRRGPGPQDEER